MKEVKITYSELMKGLDKFRTGCKTIHSLTKEQVDFLKECREAKNKRPVTWEKMIELWQQVGWGDTSESALRRLYIKVKQGKIEVIDDKKK